MRPTLPAALVLALILALPSTASVERTRVRAVEYWIGAVNTTWNVVPDGKDAMTGQTFDPAKTTMPTTIYRGFSANWAQQLPGGNQGFTGPIIKARAGDTILVHFKNFDPARPHSMHFHGVHYDIGSDGAYIPGVSGPGANVPPGGTFTYKLEPGDDSVGAWPYHDHSPSMMDSITGGMYGALSILARNEKAPDREFVVFFESQLKLHTIDGLAFINNTPQFQARVGDLVQWDVLALGDDTHSFHVHGHRWDTADGSRDVQVVSPASSFRIRWKEDKVGAWLYHC